MPTYPRRVTIKRTQHGGQNYAAYEAGVMFATLHGEKPSKANNRQAHWSLCYLTGRTEWFDTLTEAKDYALKGR